MIESGFIKDCSCTVIVSNIAYKGVIIDIDKDKLKFMRQIQIGPVSTFEVIYIFNPQKNITAIHYDYNELSGGDKVDFYMNRDVDFEEPDVSDLIEPTAKKEVVEKYSEAIRKKDYDTVVETHKAERSGLLNAIQKRFKVVPPPTNIRGEKTNPFGF